MRLIILCCFLLLSLSIQIASAGEVREIELTDGSTITGEVQSLGSGIFTIKSESLGTIRVEESKIRAIRAKSSTAVSGAGPGSGNTTGAVKNLQEKMTGDKDIMALIQSLQDSPEFKKILEDPEIMKAVNDGDVAALTANPRFMKLLDNTTVKEIEKKVK
jgi:hypothetical protein